MKRLLTLAVIVLATALGNAAFAQETRKERRDAERARLKAEEAQEDQQAYQQAVAAINAKQFVVEADQLYLRNGNTVFVNEVTNFLMVNEERGTVQVAFNNAIAGPNGIGGVTVDGTISGMQVNTDKRGNIHASFNIQGIGISAQIFFTLVNGDNNATVTISPNFNSNTLVMSGSLVPLADSDVYKAQSF